MKDLIDGIICWFGHAWVRKLGKVEIGETLTLECGRCHRVFSGIVEPMFHIDLKEEK